MGCKFIFPIFFEELLHAGPWRIDPYTHPIRKWMKEYKQKFAPNWNSSD
jgi:hypothetical protein